MLSPRSAIPASYQRSRHPVPPQTAKQLIPFSSSDIPGNIQLAAYHHQRKNVLSPACGLLGLYVNHMHEVNAKLTRILEDAPDKLPVARTILETYKHDYVAKIVAMFQGPDPDKSANSFYAWRELTLYKMEQTMREPIRTSDPDALKLLDQKLATLQATQERMVAANKIIRSKKLTEEAKIQELNKIGIEQYRALGLIRQNGYAAWELQNNNSNITRLKKRLAEVTEKKTQSTSEHEFNGGRVVDNVEEDRIQIFFDDIPAAEIRDQLKHSGFRWAPSIGAWQSYRNTNGNYYTEKFTGVKL